MRVCLIAGRRDIGVGALVDAIHRYTVALPAIDDEIDMVWADDPHLRPPAIAGIRWVDFGLDEPLGIGWNRLLVALDPPLYRLARGLRAAARLLENDQPVLLLNAGGVGVLDALPSTVASANGLALVNRRIDPSARKSGVPQWNNLAALGRYSTQILGAGIDAAPALKKIADGLCNTDSSLRVGADALFTTLVDDVANRRLAAIQSLESSYVIGWGEPPERVALVDVTSLNLVEPRLVDIGHQAPQIRLSEHPHLARAIGSAAAQWRIDPSCSSMMPGGIILDQVVSDLVADGVDRWRRGDGPLPPDPYTETANLLEWLETPWPPWGPDIGRYWNSLRQTRHDLLTAFEQPEGRDLDSFVVFSRRAWFVEESVPFALGSGHQRLRPAWTNVGHQREGVNLIGYLGFDQSLGDVARRVERALSAAQVPHNNLHYHRSGSPTSVETPTLTERLDYRTNLAIINADHFLFLDTDYGEVLFDGRRTIGYWFWELHHIPPKMRSAFKYLDELWVATDFTRDAFRAVADIPVETVPIPVPEPVVSDAPRAALDIPEGRFVFLVTFDHLSVTERKHPLAAVEAFQIAFPEPSDDGPVLFVKSINRSHRWAEAERLLLAADGRPDIIVHDVHLSRPDQMALIGHADCMVSLHRAEGLGLHLMEAMWLGVPTIATGYSGNLLFQNDSNAALVGYDLVAVNDRDGYYPTEGRWAEPSRSEAAAWMQKLYFDADERKRLATAGRHTMEQQPSLAATGQLIADLIARETP